MLNVTNRQWLLHTVADPSVVHSTESFLPWVILAVGLATTALSVGVACVAARAWKASADRRRASHDAEVAAQTHKSVISYLVGAVFMCWSRA